MMLFEPMRDAFRALRINILRSVLTTLGIIIGVGAVIVMVSIGAGAQAQVEDIISSMGADVLYVFPGSTLGRARMGTGSLPTLTEDDAEAIQKKFRKSRLQRLTFAAGDRSSSATRIGIPS